MAIHIETLDAQDILEVTYTPDTVTKEDLSDQRHKLAAEITKNKVKKVLIDASALKSLPAVLTLYGHNVEVASQASLRFVRFSVLCNTLGERERFLEISGRNLGVQIKCFTCKEKALAWLNNA